MTIPRMRKSHPPRLAIARIERPCCFGRSVNRHRASRLPILRCVLLVCAGCAAVLDAALGSYHDSEQVLFAQLLERLEAGLLLVTGRGFSSFMAFWVVRQRESHLLCRHHQTRRGRRIQVLGFQDELQCWSCKDVRFVRSAAWLPWLAQVDADLWVRVLARQIVRKGYRTFTLRLCTSLLDPQVASAEQLVKLYLKRWRIEGVIRDLKVDYAVNRLRGKTPMVARKEYWSGLLAYTLASAVRSEGARACAAEAWSVSARRTRRLLLCFIDDRLLQFAQPSAGGPDAPAGQRERGFTAHLLVAGSVRGCMRCRATSLTAESAPCRRARWHSRSS